MGNPLAIPHSTNTVVIPKHCHSYGNVANTCSDMSRSLGITM